MEVQYPIPSEGYSRSFKVRKYFRKYDTEVQYILRKYFRKYESTFVLYVYSCTTCCTKYVLPYEGTQLHT
jgi:hypothetical protein